MKKIHWIAFFLFGVAAFTAFKSFACGHEGLYAGIGYTQLLQFSKDNQLTAAGVAAEAIKWKTRVGAHAKVGYDVCGTRFGFEMPVMVAKQQLNRTEDIYVIHVDANSIIHLIETEKGADFFWVAGVGVGFVTEGKVDNNTASAGMGFNFGPGFQYFFSQGKHRSAAHVMIPVRLTSYTSDTLSKGNTLVLSVPVQVGFTVAF